jgi:hypothetical protein
LLASGGEVCYPGVIKPGACQRVALSSAGRADACQSDDVTVTGALTLLVALLVVSPLSLFYDGPSAQAALTLWAALAVGASALFLSASDVDPLRRILRVPLLLALVPLLAMLLQLAPLPFLVPAIWSSAAAALDSALVPSVTVDSGATVLAIMRYLTFCGVTLATIAVCLDRHRAQLVLIVLCAVCVVAGLLLFLAELVAPGTLARGGDKNALAPFGDLAALGIMLSDALALQAFFARDSKRAGLPSATAGFAIGLGVFGFFLCAIAVGFFAPERVLLRAVAGLAVIGLFLAARRMRARSWELGGLAALIVLAAAMIVAGRATPGELFLRAVPFLSASSLAQRLFADTGWFGNGAGSYGAMVPLYLGTDAAAHAAAPTLAAKFMIEFGAPVALLFVALAAVLVVLLFRRALARRRDGLYPALASAGVAMTAIGVFSEADLAASASIVLTAAIIGLGLAQSVSAERR